MACIHYIYTLRKMFLTILFNGYETPTHSPSVILSIEQEVRAHDGHAHRHNAQYNQDQHHEAVHVVDFVGPE